MGYLISSLSKRAGFFSEMFFMFNHYLFCKDNNLLFCLKTDKWLFKYKKGWNDYFEYSHCIEGSVNTLLYGHGFIIKQYKIKDYKIAIDELYKYNSITKEKIHNTKVKLGLNSIDYGSIFIRRGDKLLSESILHPTERYIDLLLYKYPNCKTIFIQTDDYNCILDAEKYLKGRNINIITICNKDMRGVFVNNHSIDTRINSNIFYLNSIKDNIVNYKTLHQMNPDEIYEHTLEMIIGLDIVINSKYCVFDYQSNVSRFIKLAHVIPDNVFDIQGYDMDMNSLICPAYSSSIYNIRNRLPLTG
jgi:hypothetical protein